MSTLSFESLRLKEDDCTPSTQPQAMENDFDTDLESDGEYISSFLGSLLGKEDTIHFAVPAVMM